MCVCVFVLLDWRERENEKSLVSNLQNLILESGQLAVNYLTPSEPRFSV